MSPPGVSLVLGELTHDYTVTPCAGDVVSLTCTVSGALLTWDVPQPTEDITVESRTMIPLSREGYTVTSVMVANSMITSSLSFSAVQGITIGCVPFGMSQLREELTIEIASKKLYIIMFTM